MSGVYTELADGEGPVSPLLNPARTATGLVGLALVGLAGFARSQWTNLGHLFSSSNNEQAGGWPAFVPKEELGNVVVKPGAPNLFQMLGVNFFGNGPTCLFSYGTLLQDDEADAAFIKGVDSKQEAWLYGAQAFGQFAHITGAPGDVLKGRLLCWPANTFKERLRTADQQRGYEPGKTLVRRDIVSVVLQDGSSAKAYWYYQSEPGTTTTAPPLSSTAADTTIRIPQPATPTQQQIPLQALRPKPTVNRQLRWLDPLQFVDMATREPVGEEMVLPMFPMGNAIHLPESDQVLSIYEKRYTTMYSDILMSGSRRFVVPVMHETKGLFSEVASIFYLDELKEVSKQTGGEVKYICNHKIIGRVRIKRLLNARAWTNTSDYMRVLAEPLVDMDTMVNYTLLEKKVEHSFMSIAKLQTKLQEFPRFLDTVFTKLSAHRNEKGFWLMANIWMTLLRERIIVKEMMLQSEIQEQLREYLITGKGVDMSRPDLKITLRFEDLPNEVRNRLTTLQDKFRDEAGDLLVQMTTPFHLLIQSESHGERLVMLYEMIEGEQKRLQAKSSLMSLFPNQGGR
eukprot:gb/GEZN01002044.1/.p1 GENE.gb/GEZN01002044.1/~~gb/GEZN01002044.1/.p1  ORF type:complete len:568 (+),score=89.19 gb/GEZN01002044.1/:244-1947(+)